MNTTNIAPFQMTICNTPVSKFLSNFLSVRQANGELSPDAKCFNEDHYNYTLEELYMSCRSLMSTSYQSYGTFAIDHLKQNISNVMIQFYFLIVSYTV